MNERQILTVQCPCGVNLQVKTRSAEKLVTCPKCGASMMVSAPAAAPEQLPFAVKLDAPQTSLPTAEPATLPFAQPVATMLPVAAPLPSAAPRSSPGTGRPGAVPVAIAISAVVVLLGVGVFFAMRAGNGTPAIAHNSAEGGGKGSGESIPGEGSEAETAKGQGAAVQQPIQSPQQDSAAAAKAKLDQAASRIQSLERQKRDWLLANAGRAGASGKKQVVWPNERLLTQARQELEMAEREYERSQ